jgi:hypothetical protein
VIGPRAALVSALCGLLLACSGDQASPTPTPTSLPRVGGTIVPGNNGSTNPVSINPRPNPPVGVSILQDVRVGAHPEAGRLRIRGLTAGR